MNRPRQRGHHPHHDPSRKDPYILPYSIMAICYGCCAFAIYAHPLRHPNLRNYVTRNFVCSPRNMREGRYHTLITSGFMHFSLHHLAANMVSLYFIGPHVIDLLGPLYFLTLWAGGSFMGNVAQLWHFRWLEGQAPVVLPLLHPTFPGALRSFRPLIHRQIVGASGSILSMTTMIAGVMRNNLLMFLGPFPLPSHEAVGVIAAGSVCCICLDLFPGIGHVGHLGGMAFGAACYCYYSSGRRSKKTKGRRLDGRDAD